ncbi:MAG: bifunctional [glutamate--ammonia ligase]-adenylyl-L-tyrosine phosphorylase/[glutamate--ammonia-ligase] adenylyltransferase [Verrucomicrobia bacterium]|nr:bifunctional [glutamate--ammonia ligase]-adenylyl-L-tyrosine phosphorylase/[glutamate--ammonia-ligase] adenylyltransferase [Verrucomicrobiota bacterium]
MIQWMARKVWRQAVDRCADPERAASFLRQLGETGAATFLAEAAPEQAVAMAALLSGSQAQGERLAGRPEWVAATFADLDGLRRSRSKESYVRPVRAILDSASEGLDDAGRLDRLRELQQREMMRIAARDLSRLGDVESLTLELSHLADAVLEGVLDLIRRPLETRWGLPWQQDADGRWEPTRFAVIGLGKLGGQELNYSSDVDVIFAYSDEGSVFREAPKGSATNRPSLSNHTYFTRLAEAFVAEVGRMTPSGMLYRIDLRLRPEGAAGPLARSLSSYEDYYAQWGQTWERMMLMKARGVAGDPALAGEFLEMIQPFRHPRSPSERVLREVAAVKRRIETEVVKAGELERNVKLGRGGIREIEFLVQTLQLLHAGRQPFLQNRQTLGALGKLAEYRLLGGEEALALADAYRFLRNVEHRLQMEAHRQTHTVPLEEQARRRLAALMGFGDIGGFEAAWQEHARRVRQSFDRLVRSEAPAGGSGLPAQIQGAEAEWRRILEIHRFRDPEKALRLLESLVHGPGYVHVSARTAELGLELIPRLLGLCPRRDAPAGDRLDKPVLSDPDRVLARLDSFIAAYGARATLFELWAGKPALFELLLRLFDRSEFLAELAIRVPDLVDELEESGRLRRPKSSEETLQDLRHGIEDPDQRLWIRRYHQAEFMRLGLRDILGLADFEHNLSELTALADACLQYALEVAMRENRLDRPPLAVIGLGKLGGGELTYGSDLDVLFVADSRVRDLERARKAAARIIDLLSAPTELGIAFKVDARLRPDGEKGLLVNTLKAYEDYYRSRAMLWEIQTLTRSRMVAGDLEVGRRFQEMADRLTDFSRPSQPLAAYRPDWKQVIAGMRARIEKERVPAGKAALAFKTGAGGLMDAEFIAQTLCLENGWHEPNTLRALAAARDRERLPREDGKRLIENYRRLRRIEGILRRWSYEGENELPDDPAPLYRVAVRCGFSDAEPFMRYVSECRQTIRGVYEKVFAL